MKHNSIVAYKVRLEDVRKHLRAKFNDQTIEVEVCRSGHREWQCFRVPEADPWLQHIGTEFVFYLPVTLTEVGCLVAFVYLVMPLTTADNWNRLRKTKSMT